MSQLFAFRTAQRAPASFAAETSHAYDPQAQTGSWESGTPLLAVHCTHWTRACPAGGRPKCNAYGSYCTTYGSGYGYYTCD